MRNWIKYCSNNLSMDLTPLVMDMVSILSTASMGIFAAYVIRSMINDKRKQYEDNSF